MQCRCISILAGVFSLNFDTLHTTGYLRYYKLLGYYILLQVRTVYYAPSWGIAEKSPLSCSQVSPFLSTSLHSLDHNSPLPCPQVSTLLSTSVRSLVHKFPLLCSQVSTSLSTSICSLVHKSPLCCPQVSTRFSKTLHYFVHKSRWIIVGK